VYAQTGAGEGRVWAGEVTHPVGETAEQLEQRWDGFARLMFRQGLEPVSDEPAYTLVVDGEVMVGYALQEIWEEL
jgi:hypothetical protein